MSKIMIKNISSSNVFISAPYIRFRRELTPGRSIPVSKEDYDELCFDTGFATLVRGGFLKVTGVEEEEQAIETNEDVMEAQEIYKILSNRDITKFAQFIPKATAAEKDSAIKYAIELHVVDGGFPALFKKYCDIDIVEAVSNTYHATEQ